jgi:signal transduction histidine kinase
MPVKSRVILTAGFGGLLLLMTFSAVDGIQALQQIQTSNDTIREQFLNRTRVLERIRADVYVSGTYVRDYLLEPESGKAEGHRDSLVEDRRDMDSALAEYRTLIDDREIAPFQGLIRQLTDYWSVLEPVFRWTPGQRRRDGYLFLRDEVFPRRQSMLAIANQIGALNEAQLDAGRLKVEETFRQSRRRLALTVLLTVGLGLILAIFTTRKILGLEDETAGHYSEMAQAREELQQLSARLVQAQEEERRSISRELHDEVGQSLTGVLVEMANVSTLIRARDLDGVAVKAAEVKRLLEGSIGVVRNMALLLRPSMLDDLGLVPALEWQAREVSKRGGVWVEVDAASVPEDLPEEHKTCVYRVVQEALHNIVQHASARRVKIAVRQDQGRLILAIEDDGRGFDPRLQKGMGLVGMEERVRHLGGSFEVQSRPGAGAVLHISLPLPATVTA